MLFRILYISLFIFFHSYTPALSQFQIEDSRKSRFVMEFQLVNDLVVIPVELNGLELSFLLDTGVNSTILFSLDKKDTLELRNTEYIYLRGLGEGKPFQAIKSSQNSLKIGKAVNRDITLFVVHDNPINVSNRMGIPIHGIIGYEFFKGFILEFDYNRQK